MSSIESAECFDEAKTEAIEGGGHAEGADDDVMVPDSAVQEEKKSCPTEKDETTNDFSNKRPFDAVTSVASGTDCLADDESPKKSRTCNSDNNEDDKSSNNNANGSNEGIIDETMKEANGGNGFENNIDKSKKARAKCSDGNNKNAKGNNNRSSGVHNLNESTTIDDLTSIDAATYMAWVARQRDQLPDVFISSPTNTADTKQDEDDSSHTAPPTANPDNAGTGGKTKTINENCKNDAREQEGTIVEGSIATLQTFLSTMEILPPPSILHLPPRYAQIDEMDKTNYEEETADTGDSLNINDTNTKANPTSKINSSELDCSKWVSATISNFSKLRSYLEHQSSLLKQQKQQALQNQHSQRTQQPQLIPVPKMKDRAAWHIFCLGKEEARGNAGGYFEDLEDSADDASADSGDGNGDWESGGGDCPVNDHSNGANGANGDGNKTHNGGQAKTMSDGPEKSDPCANTSQHTPAPNKSIKSNRPNQSNQLIYNPEQVPSKGHSPTTSLLLQLDQVLTRTLFHHHVAYLCEWKFPLTKHRAAWIYALLARMEKPWHRDECCAVRRVLRECCVRRWGLCLKEIEVEAGGRLKRGDEREGKDIKGADGLDDKVFKEWEQLALLNTLIAIAGIYYEQGSFAGGDGMDSLFKVLEKS